MDTKNYYTEAVKELSTAKNVSDWNLIRSKWVDLLTREELAIIDGDGLIIKTLGKDDSSSLSGYSDYMK